jgi:hypothetical protein
MKWFRSNIRLGSRLAICALAIQFLLSFGHFHHASLHATSAAVQEPRTALDESCSFGVRTPDAWDRASYANASDPVCLKISSGHLPSGQGTPGQGTDHCAICAVMAFANAMALASPPDLPTPQATAFLDLASDLAFVETNSARLPFQPRAPPVA